jgi:hypothetical protein
MQIIPRPITIKSDALVVVVVVVTVTENVDSLKRK